MPELINQALSFGPFKVLPDQRLLLEHERPVRLGSRALDILIALVDRAGEVVGKRELIALVWPRAVVEEGALRVHMAALRKVLGDGHAGARYIINVPGRGYSFVAPLSRLQAAAPAGGTLGTNDQAARIPARLTHMVGRNDTVTMLDTQLPKRRLVTLVGPGGIGKTTVAVAVADVTGNNYPHGAYFVDFSPLASGELVTPTLASTLGLSDAADGLLARVKAFVRDKQLLIVLDNCEHIAPSLVPVLEALLSTSPGLRVLATSREPLRAAGEWLHHLPSLTIPPSSANVPVAQALTFSAFELFVERATASLDSFQASDSDVPLITELCRRLDGNPLAIELAAAHVDVFGLPGLLTQLQTHILQLRQPRRSALPRHQTLGSVLDWSYRLLAPEQQQLLSMLAIFRGRFSLEAAHELLLAVDRQSAPTASHVLNLIVELSCKSWLASDTSGDTVRYHFLEIPHAYALAKLEESGRYAALSGYHARYIHGLMTRASAEWTAVTHLSEWVEEYKWWVDDIRAALAWCFSRNVDLLLGISLTALVAPAVSFLNPFDEPDALERAANALASLRSSHPQLELAIHSAVAAPHSGSRATPAREKSRLALLDIAQHSTDPALRARALVFTIVNLASSGNYTQCVQQMEPLAQAARLADDVDLIVLADRFSANEHSTAGHHEKARALAERVLRNPIRRAPLHVAGGVDYAISMRIVLARTLWLQGFADKAVQLALATLERAAPDGGLARAHAFALAACPIALWRGDDELACRLIGQFHAELAEHLLRGLRVPDLVAIPWQLLLPGAGGAAEYSDMPLISRAVDYLITADPQRVTHEDLARTLGDLNWSSPEVLRAYGEKLQHTSPDRSHPQARSLFEQALSLSREQAALAWELRAATSLARLHRDCGDARAAYSVLEPVYSRITEGFGTADVTRAASLLQELRHGHA